MSSTEASDDEVGGEQYKWEKLLKHRFNDESGVYEYYTKWEGYPSSENTWQTAVSFSSVDAVKGYWERIEDKVEDRLKNCHPNKRNHFMELHAEVKKAMEVDVWPRWELETTLESQEDDEGSTEKEDEDEVRRQAKAKKKAENEAGGKSRRDDEAGPSTKKQDKEKKKARKQPEVDEAAAKKMKDSALWKERQAQDEAWQEENRKKQALEVSKAREVFKKADGDKKKLTTPEKQKKDGDKKKLTTPEKLAEQAKKQQEAEEEQKRIEERRKRKKEKKKARKEAQRQKRVQEQGLKIKIKRSTIEPQLEAQDVEMESIPPAQAATPGPSGDQPDPPREPSPDPPAVKRARRSPSATPMLEIVEASPEEMPDPPQKDVEEPQQAAQEEAPVETSKFGGWIPNIMEFLAWEKVDPNKPPPKPYKRIDPKTLGLDPDLLLEDEEEDNKPYNCRTVVSVRHRDLLISRRLWSTLPDLPVPEPGETLITKWDSCGIALGYEPSFIKRIARAELGPFVTVEYRDRQDVQLIPAEFLLMTRPDLHYQVKQRLKTLPATVNTLATEIQWRLPGLELLKF
ncbi:unnamed protein product, partial [Mesorhabditis spiculigera]